MSGLESIRRRDFRNNARAFVHVLRLKGVEAYLRQAFPEQLPVITVAYNLINGTSSAEEYKRIKRRDFINRAEIYASILMLPGVEEYLRLRPRGQATVATAYNIIDPTERPQGWGEDEKTRH